MRWRIQKFYYKNSMCNSEFTTTYTYIVLSILDIEPAPIIDFSTRRFINRMWRNTHLSKRSKIFHDTWLNGDKFEWNFFFLFTCHNFITKCKEKLLVLIGFCFSNISLPSESNFDLQRFLFLLNFKEILYVVCFTFCYYHIVSLFCNFFKGYFANNLKILFNS